MVIRMAALIKTFNNHTVQISHTVAQVSADETNRIAAYCFNTGKTMGVNWHKANGTFTPTSNAISTANRTLRRREEAIPITQVSMA